jgi:5'-3' exonuclease
MGVLLYYQSLSKLFGDEIIVPYPPQENLQMDHIYFDLNNLLYGIAMKAKTEEEFTSLLIKKMIQTLKEFPSGVKTIFLAIDGPAPRAKLLTQRERRFKPATASTFGISKKKPFLISPLNFTPGTEFLNNLKEKLKEFCFQSLVLRKKYQHTSFLISGADSIGEGEFKIFEHIKSLSKEKENILVVGSDSDLLLFGLKTFEKKNVFVLKEKDILFDTQKLRNKILSMKKATNEKRIIEDFIFLSLLNGNDYFPKIRGYNFANTLKDYFTSNSYLIDYNENDLTIKINWKFFFQILKVKEFNQKSNTNYEHPKSKLTLIFSKSFGKNLIYHHPDESNENLVEVYFDTVKLMEYNGTSKKDAHLKSSQMILDSLSNEEFLKKFLPSHVEPNEMMIEIDRILETVASEEPSEQPLEHNLNDLFQNYFEGVIWVFQYLSGICSNYSFYFKFENFPTNIKENNFKETYQLEEKLVKPLPPAVFCLILIPLKHVHTFIKNEELRNLVNHEDVKDLFHGNFKQLQEVWNQENSIQRIEKAVEKNLQNAKGLKFKSTLKLQRFENQILESKEILFKDFTKKFQFRLKNQKTVNAVNTLIKKI